MVLSQASITSSSITCVTGRLSVTKRQKERLTRWVRNQQAV